MSCTVLKKSVTHTANYQIGIWGMAEYSRLSAVVSSKKKLNFPPCKFFVPVLSQPNSLANLFMLLYLVLFIYCVSTEA